jgi:predicted amidophosphoribosyltransferase
VHHLKYRGLAAAGRVLAAQMVPLLPEGAAALVPVPRVLTRLVGYGVDPARELARELGRAAGLPVVPILVRPLWWPRRAGPAGAFRGAPAFRARRPVPVEAVLIDDVMTTGATLTAARRPLPAVRWALTATVAPSLGGRSRYHQVEAHSGPVEHGSVRVVETAADEIP